MALLNEQCRIGCYSGSQINQPRLVNWGVGGRVWGVVNATENGFYDPPFRLRSEVSVDVETMVENETLRGRIDFLVIQEQFWRTVIESKETEFDIEVGIPQTLAYMMANPMQDKPLFGLVTNGNSFIFLKVRQGKRPEYDFSETYSLLSRTNRLYEVLQILKGIVRIVIQ